MVLDILRYFSLFISRMRRSLVLSKYITVLCYQTVLCANISNENAVNCAVFFTSESSFCDLLSSATPRPPKKNEKKKV
jgi:hypothetical protein